MPHTETLPVTYHQQESAFYCGAACSQMLLSHLGATLLDQSALDYEIENHNSEGVWAAGPDGLEHTLNFYKPSGFTTTFSITAVKSKEILSRKIAWTIQRTQSAIPVLIGANHWIIVCGFDATAKPTSSTDISYAITGFYVNNPAPAVTTTPPPPHNTSDLCGSGGIHGFAKEHVNYSSWISTYLLPIPFHSSWKDQYIAIGNPDPLAASAGLMLSTPHPFNGSSIITPEEAIRQAEKVIDKSVLRTIDPWKTVAGAKRFLDPILVQRLDRNDSYYYIVPIGTKEKQASILINIDARFGDYLESAAIDPTKVNGDALKGLDFDPKRALQTVLNRSIQDDRGRGFVVRPESYSIQSTCVWRPCRESMTPYLPFFLIHSGARSVYVRVDGQVFPKLTLTDIGI